jgi:hypothetical protein
MSLCAIAWAPAEEGHNAALKRMERFAVVVNSQELMQTWRR